MADDALRFVVKAIAIKDVVQVTLAGLPRPELLEAISQLYGRQVVLVPDEEADPASLAVLKPTVVR